MVRCGNYLGYLGWIQGHHLGPKIREAPGCGQRNTCDDGSRLRGTGLKVNHCKL